MPLPLYPILFPGLESCIPISIQSPFLYYFLLLPPPTLVLLVALPRTSCITIISLQFKRIVSWRIAFLQGWPRICVRLTNMTSLPPVFSSSFSSYICWIFFFEFVDLFILRRKNVEEECWIGGNEPTKVSRSRWLYLYRSCMLCCISMNVYYVKLDFWSLMEELGHFLFTFYLGENYFYLLKNLRFDGKVIKSYCYYYFLNKIWNGIMKSTNIILSLYKNMKGVFNK